MALPMKANDQNIAPTEELKETKLVNKLIQGVEENLNNLSDSLKIRFKRLVESQMSLFRYRENHPDATLDFINKFKQTKKADNELLSQEDDKLEGPNTNWNLINKSKPFKKAENEIFAKEDDKLGYPDADLNSINKLKQTKKADNEFVAEDDYKIGQTFKNLIGNKAKTDETSFLTSTLKENNTFDRKIHTFAKNEAGNTSKSPDDKKKNPENVNLKPNQTKISRPTRNSPLDQQIENLSTKVHELNETLSPRTMSTRFTRPETKFESEDTTRSTTYPSSRIISSETYKDNYSGLTGIRPTGYTDREGFYSERSPVPIPSTFPDDRGFRKVIRDNEEHRRDVHQNNTVEAGSDGFDSLRRSGVSTIKTEANIDGFKTKLPDTHRYTTDQQEMISNSYKTYMSDKSPTSHVKISSTLKVNGLDGGKQSTILRPTLFYPTDTDQLNKESTFLDTQYTQTKDQNIKSDKTGMKELSSSKVMATHAPSSDTFNTVTRAIAGPKQRKADGIFVTDQDVSNIEPCFRGITEYSPTRTVYPGSNTLSVDDEMCLSSINEQIESLFRSNIAILLDVAAHLVTADGCMDQQSLAAYRRLTCDQATVIRDLLTTIDANENAARDKMDELATDIQHLLRISALDDTNKRIMEQLVNEVNTISVVVGMTTRNKLVAKETMSINKHLIELLIQIQTKRHLQENLPIVPDQTVRETRIDDKNFGLSILPNHQYDGPGESTSPLNIQEIRERQNPRFKNSPVLDNTHATENASPYSLNTEGRYVDASNPDNQVGEKQTKTTGNIDTPNRSMSTCYSPRNIKEESMQIDNETNKNLLKTSTDQWPIYSDTSNRIGYSRLREPIQTEHASTQSKDFHERVKFNMEHRPRLLTADDCSPISFGHKSTNIYSPVSRERESSRNTYPGHTSTYRERESMTKSTNMFTPFSRAKREPTANVTPGHSVSCDRQSNQIPINAYTGTGYYQKFMPSGRDRISMPFGSDRESMPVTRQQYTPVNRQQTPSPKTTHAHETVNRKRVSGIRVDGRYHAPHQTNGNKFKRSIFFLCFGVVVGLFLGYAIPKYVTLFHGVVLYMFKYVWCNIQLVHCHTPVV